MRPVLKAFFALIVCLLPTFVTAQLVRGFYTYELLDESGNQVVLNDLGTNIDVCANVEYLFRITIGTGPGSPSRRLLIRPTSATPAPATINDVILNKGTGGGEYCANGILVHTCHFRLTGDGTYTIEIGEEEQGGGLCDFDPVDVAFNFQAQNNSYFELDPTYDVCSGAAFVLTQEGAGSNDRCNSCATNSITVPRGFSWQYIDSRDLSGTVLNGLTLDAGVANATGDTIYYDPNVGSPNTNAANYTLISNDINEVNNATSKNGGIMRFRARIVTDYGSFTCTSDTLIDVYIRPAPELDPVAIVSTTSGGHTLPGNDDDLCINGNRNYDVDCIGGGCPDGSTGTYLWEFVDNGNVVRSSIGAGTITTPGGGVASNSDVSIVPNTLPLATGTPIGAGDYTLSVTATSEVFTNPISSNTITCSDDVTRAMTINPQPHVEIFHNRGVGGTDASDFTAGNVDNIQICNGVELALTLQSCAAANFTANAAPGAAGGNPNLPGADPWSQPCTGPSDNLFASVTWAAVGEDGATGANLTGPAGNPSTPATGTSIVTTPIAHVPTDNYVTTTADMTGATGTLPGNIMTYTATATGVNGCINTDQLTVDVQDPTITFQVNGGSAVASGSTVQVCQASQPTMSVICDLCQPTTSFSSINWSGGAPLNNTNTNNVQYNSPIATSTGVDVYTVNLTGNQGCLATGATINLDIDPQPTLTPTVTTPQPMCDGNPLVFSDGNYDPNARYGIFTSDPRLSSPTDLLNCASGCAPISLTNPSNGENYWVRKINSGGCEAVAQVGIITNIRPTPSISLQSGYPTTICNNRFYTFRINGDADYVYTWFLDTSSIVPPSGSYYTPGNAGVGISSRGFGWTPDNVYYSLNPGMSAQPNFRISVRADLNGCPSPILSIPDIEVQDCNEPVIDKFLTNGPNSLARDYRFICLGDELEVRATLPNATAGVTYLWSTGATTQSITYVGTVFSPDSIVHTVTVTDQGVSQEVNTVTYISKGGVDLQPATDTTICGNGQINAIANCPGCMSDVTYLWYNDLTVPAPTPFETDAATDGNIVQSAVVVAPNSTIPAFLMRLIVTHGETCQDTLDRQITVDGLPEPVIRNAVTGDTIRSVQYLCAGETLQLDVGCATCSSFIWNTTATTPSINVNGPGVYFARAINANLCSDISQTVVVLSSSEGSNAPVTVNPTEICSGQPSTLEVAPCIGCSYAWFNTTNPAIPVSTNRIFPTAIAGNYYAEITNTQSCVYPTSIVNLVNTAVTIPTIAITTDSICPGRTSTLSTTSLAGATYQWYRDNLPVSGAIDSIYTVSEAGFYSVLVTYPNGCEEFSPSEEIVDISFNPIIASADTIVCFGLTEEITAPLTPGWQYQWFRNGDSITVNGNGSNYFADSAGSYYVEIVDNNLCKEASNLVTMTISNIPTSFATTSTPSICPGEDGSLAVSLCSGCSYEWFNINTASSLSQGNAQTYYRFLDTSVASTSSYFAVVSKDGCQVLSDTITIVLNSAPIPPINFISRVVCDGRDALLNTQACTGCSYSWQKDGGVAVGALNDTFHVVDRVANVGMYSVIVNYPNGCSVESAATQVFNGSFNVNIASAQQLGTAPNTVICNGSGMEVRANTIYPGVAPVGTYTYTLFVDNNPVTGASNITTNASAYSFFNNVTEGVYTIGVVDPQGCRQKSGFISLDTVNIVPLLEARATSNPNSVPASAICDADGTVYMEVTIANCPTCTYTYQWAEGGIPIVGASNNTYQTPQGPTGAGIYTVDVTRRGCSATSNTASIIDATATFNNTITPNIASICNGQSTTLAYNGATCIGCSYRWLRTNNPIGGANNQQYVATTLGSYTLEVTTPLGCVDTSNISLVRSIARPDSLRLQLDTVVAILGTANSGTATPIAASAATINLNSWVFPDSVRNASLAAASGDSSYFSSTPFNAALNCGGAAICNPGLSGTDSILFTPADSLVGNHLITYHYFESGCEFIVQDILRVLPAATISITNNNPLSVPYEACIGDNLSIRAENLKFRIEEIYVFDANGDYQLATIPAINFSYDTVSYGSDTFYTTVINWTVPGNAYASYLNLKAAPPAGQDTILTPFLLIHNTDLSFSGLPNSGELCSNGERLTLFGNPQGGIFSVQNMAGGVMPGTIVADSLYPTAIDPSLYNDTSQLVDVVYSYRQTYTNSNNCPTLDFVTQRIKVIDVQLNSVEYNPISISQDQERLINLVYTVSPYNARAHKQGYYNIGFSGSFTSPAGAPETFLPSNAGVGRHALTYIISKGTCTNMVEDSIEVLPAPTDILIPDTICRNFAPVNFSRHTAFPFIPNVSPIPPSSSVVYRDSVYLMRVRGEGVIINNGFIGSENFTYDPNNVLSGNYDTLVIDYVFYREQDTSSVGFDTFEYVVASIVKPIYIEDLLTVDINDTVVQSFYCQDSTLSVLTASPADTFGRGLFMLFGGTGQYQFGDTLPNSVINPYQVNNSENATTTYDLVYILNGVACQNSDTMPITISKGLNPAFATVNGLTEFCDTDPGIAITHNVLAPDTAIWKIGGIPQPSYSFNPNQLSPGIHIVELQQIYTYIQAPDTFTCSASAVDTFTVHALPNINVTPSLDKQYCANDSIVDFMVSPAPDCPNFGAAGQYVLNENFDAGVPASWLVNTIAGKPWAPDALFPQGGVGLATFVDTSGVVENSWLISPTMNLIAGHTYRLSYMVLAGPPDPNCGSGCFASLYVGIGNAPATTAITTQLDYQPLLDNDLAYRRYTVDYYHDPAVGAVTGQYNMGFRNFSPAFGRSLRLDNVEMRDLTIDSCQQSGIGYMEGPGTYRVSDSLYQFDPLAVPAGDITVKYVYTNTMGCQDSVVFPITVDTAPVVSFTNLDTSYCENEPTVMITGNPLGGTFTSTRGTNLYDDTTFATLSPAFYPVSFQTNTPGLDVISYTFTDDNNCSETAVDQVSVVALLDRNPIAGLDTRGYGYCIIDSANALAVTNQPPLGSGSLITNGTFYGPGIRNGAAGAVPGGATFHSDSAVIDMGHTGDATISYVYTTTTNCLDTTFQTVRVHAKPDLSFINLPDSMCLNVDSFRVLVQNRVVTGPTGQVVYIDTIGRQVGQFTETDIFGNPVPNFIQLFDTLYPATADGYSQINVSYQYITDTLLGACQAILNDSVRIDTVPIVYFQDLRPHYCENEPASIFLAFPPFNIGSGFLMIDSVQIDSSFYWIDPAVMVGPGQTTAVYPTYYTFTDSRGCTGEAFDTFEVRPYPRITFDPAAQDTFCRQVGQLYDLRQSIISPLGGFFTDNLALTSIRDSFYLDLGSDPGPRLVTYNYLDTTTMCQNSDSIWIYLFSAPELDFVAYGGCSQMDITFDGSANNLIAGIDSITRIWWDFEGNGVLTYTQLDTSPITIPDTTYQYGASGTYNVTLYVQNQGACVQSVTKPLIISPYYNLAAGDYFEDFNAGTGDWFDEQPLNMTPNNIWTYEPTLSGTQISSGNGAWVTRADSLYGPGESAWVYSPCFDFSNSVRPMIAFDLWRDLLENIDGVIMEYYDNTTNTWERLGDVGEGILWYQSNILLSRPGAQQGVSLPR
ncbi:MAG: hypothetical protein AB8E82_10645 [Aureispira sp.]